MITRILTIGAAGFVALLAMSPAQNEPVPATATDRAIQRLEKAVLELEARLERLEARAALDSPSFLDTAPARGGTAAPPPSGDAAAGPPARVMRLDSIETAEPEIDDKELERLRDEVEGLERTVTQSDRRMASLTGSNSGGGGYRGRYSPDTSDSRERRAEAEIQADYKAKLREKQGELKRLEREMTEPKQIIYGTWENKIITLRTTRDVSRTLDRIDVGSWLTWEGRRLSEDESSQDWVITSVSKSDWQGPAK